MHEQQLWEELHRTAFLVAVFHPTFGCYKKLTGCDSSHSKTIWVRDHWVWLSELPRFNKIGVLCWNCLQVEGVCPTALFPSWPGLSVWPRSGGTETSHQLIPKSGTAESGGTQPQNLKASKCYRVISDKEVADRSQVLDLVYYLKIYQCRIWTMPGL